MARKRSGIPQHLVPVVRCIDLTEPDFSKLRFEHPQPDTAAMLQSIEDDADAEAIYQRHRGLVQGPS
jgi:hypothetical protein